MAMTPSRAKRIALLGLFTALALIFSYLEHLLPLPLPLPGFKLGLCNIVVLFVAYYMGLCEAAALSLLRVILTSLLFGGPTSFVFSLLGATLSFGTLVFSKLVLRSTVSFIGVSALSAAAFNIGQIFAASLLYTTLSVFGYLPLLLLASAALGSVVGVLLNLLAKRISPLKRERVCKKEVGP